MKILFASIVCLVVSCGPVFTCETEVKTTRRIGYDTCTVDNLFASLDGKLLTQVESFSQDAVKRNVPCRYTVKASLDENFSKSVGETVIGYCLIPWRVSIRKAFWDRASASERMALIYHELGHCALGLEHYDEKTDIMNTYLLPSDVADNKWDQLVNTMFERTKE